MSKILSGFFSLLLLFLFFSGKFSGFYSVLMFKALCISYASHALFYLSFVSQTGFWKEIE